ncbi:hypothetical protein [Mycoplasmopsis edwardii]|uniref:Uncharacterized protein n=2 Tax=Mycoplasmopsis edwardii TaxID=53558 RepID=A0ACD4PHJ6_9BACT|nr:hypothetical protein [Mycoplasmopsis edwardii]WBP84136.1 hypothetical protein Me_995_000088 [Mycoplasmopsis edwardii]
MNIEEIKKIFIKIITSTPGIKKLHGLSYVDSILTISEDSTDMSLEDMVIANETPEGWNFQIAISVLEEIRVKDLNTELYKKLFYEFRRKKIKLKNLTIILKGVVNG